MTGAVTPDAERVEREIDDYLRAQQDVDLLRFIACGSVDDGKSTLIGRLLYESNLIMDDQLAALAADSLRSGTRGGELDLALLTDGLAAEREQGITIDVAYRFFATPRRRFIVADAPGHEQYTRNMVTGASTADLAVILVDARHGLLTQTRRHTLLVSLLGVRQVVLAVNKLDIVGYDRATFERIAREYQEFAAGLGIDTITCVPTSALRGDNVVELSRHTPWYTGPTLIDVLEHTEVDATAGLRHPFRLPVQWVSRPDSVFRGVCGQVAAGSVRPGQPVLVQPAGLATSVRTIVTMDGELPHAVTGESVVLTLADDVDAGRGDLLCAVDQPCEVASRLEATVVWLHEEGMAPNRSYRLKLGTRVVDGAVTRLHHRIDVNTMAELPAERLELNEIGRCTIRTDRDVAFDRYADNRDTGAFLLVDRLSGDTVGAGMVRAALGRGRDLHWQGTSVNRVARSRNNGHQPCVVWLTGLSGAGKSTIGDLLERRLHALGTHTYLLDGDNVRHGLNQDLGFTDADRVENIRRIAEVARLLVDAGLIVIVACISPFAMDRELARSTVGPGEFCEVFVDTPLAVAEQRDPKGLYRKARRGELTSFTGIDSPYQPPTDPDVHVDTTAHEPARAVAMIVDWLRGAGLID